ncbi:MAG: hypothetical protein KF832_15225 [Caldilineaceae bacterium]|nr:hypothetical protein [Caldilineaceae bacterium]
MYNQDRIAIKQHWQQQIDQSLEAGAAVLLEGGVGHQLVDGLPALVALEQLMDERTDVTNPWLLMGGDGIAWSFAMLQASQLPALTPLYGGADQSTYLATLATLPDLATLSAGHRATGAPVGVHSWLQPAKQPGVTPSWSLLPLVLADRQAVNAPAATAEAGLQWLALVVVVLLFISALFI